MPRMIPRLTPKTTTPRITAPRTLLLGLAALALAVGGCDRFGSRTAQAPPGFQSQIPTTPIAALLAESAPTEPATTYGLVGEVKQVAPLVTGQMYALEDGSGTIWVLSETGGLAVGDRILLEGALAYESIPLAGQEQGEHYVIETAQVEVQSAAVKPEK